MVEGALKGQLDLMGKPARLLSEVIRVIEEFQDYLDDMDVKGVTVLLVSLDPLVIPELKAPWVHLEKRGSQEKLETLGKTVKKDSEATMEMPVSLV